MLSHEKPQSIRTFKEKQEFSFPITSVIFGLHLFKRAKMCKCTHCFRTADTYTHKSRQNTYQQKTERFRAQVWDALVHYGD